MNGDSVYTVIGKSAKGCYSEPLTVNAYALDIPKVELNNDDICLGGQAKFTATVSIDDQNDIDGGVNFGYTWQGYPDVATNTLEITSNVAGTSKVTFRGTAEYTRTVNEVSKNYSCYKTVQADLTTRALPVFSAYAENVCRGENVTFTVESSEPDMSYEWKNGTSVLGNGSTLTLEASAGSHTYQLTGTRSIRMLSLARRQ